VQERLAKTPPPDLLTEPAISHLPPAVQKYLRCTGAIGKPVIRNFRAVFDGEMKMSEKAGWIKIHAVQYNFYDQPGRYFHITSKIAGLPFTGLHIYENAHATMQIKLAGLITVADARGPDMDKGETVTVLNDMCFMAPSTLINPGISWETRGYTRVRAKYLNDGIGVSADLEFNENGELVNFVSEDRSRSLDGKTYEQLPWSTPIGDYREVEGRIIPHYGEAVWHYPDREFLYARFRLKEIKYNVSTSAPLR